jgi:hypothetical protein
MEKAQKERIMCTIGVLAFLAGGGLWLQQVIVLYAASNLNGAVEGPFASVATRMFFAGVLLVVGTYLLTKNSHVFVRVLTKDLHQWSTGEKVFCSRCGERIDNQAYCPFCGAKHD